MARINGPPLLLLDSGRRPFCDAVVILVTGWVFSRMGSSTQDLPLVGSTLYP